MRILLVNQFFWPDLAATSVLLTDVVRHLSEQGHDVTVICGAASHSVAENSNPPNARIIRVPNLPFRHGKLMRIISYASFYAGAAWNALRVPRPDIIVSMTTPPLLSVLGHAIKTVRSARHYIWEMDLYPDVAVDLKVLTEKSALTRIIGAVADYTRRRADGVIALGDCMKRRIAARGVPEAQIHVAHNWADSQRIRPGARRPSEGKLTVVYAGHLGMAHDIETIAGAMERLEPRGGFRFLFVGGGPRAKELEAICAAKKIAASEFYPFCTREELNRILATADIGLVTQKNECNGSLVPSKVYSQLAAGLPLLYVGPASATPGLILSQFGCGWRVECGDVDGLAGLLLTLSRGRDDVARCAQTARSVFLAHFDRPVSVNRIASILGADTRPWRAAAPLEV